MIWRPYYLLLFLLPSLLMASCVVVKDYPRDKPFVFQTKLNLVGKFPAEETDDLNTRLYDQLHDSVRPRRVDLVVGSRIRKPPVWDTSFANKSLNSLEALLHSQGYYRDSIIWRADTAVVRDQQRVTLAFTIVPGRLFRIDSIAYSLSRPDTVAPVASTQYDLQAITAATLNNALIRKGSPFAIPLMASERDRLTNTFRDRGYLRFTSDDLRVVWDTVGIALLRPAIDPFEQFQLLERQRLRRLNPVADVEYILKPGAELSHLRRYYIGNSTYYPDLNADTNSYYRATRIYGGDTVFAFRDLYKDRVVREGNLLRKGDLYNQQTYLRTVNRYNAVGTWQGVVVEQVPRGETDTVDFVFKLTPADKYDFDANLEPALQWGSLLTGNFLVGAYVSLQNRNFGRAGNQSRILVRGATDVGSKSRARSQQFSANYTVDFPRPIPRFKSLSPLLRQNLKTQLGVGINYISRINYLDFTTLNASWGYATQWKNKTLSVRLPNIEFAFLTVRRDLQTAINMNRSLALIFNQGFVSSVSGNFSVVDARKSRTNVLRAGLEASGLITGLIPSKFIDSNLYRFLKFDLDLTKNIALGRKSLVFRLFTGVGIPMELFDNDPRNQQLPFFRAYIAGGANSMRAWQLRQLGPGSSVKSFDRTQFPDRFGDLQLEFNTEYRFPLFKLGQFQIESALFTDMGNIWTIRKNEDFPGGNFKFGNLWRDLAVGAGTGLRINFTLFIIRTDWSYKLKDPSPAVPEKQNIFFPGRSFRNGNFVIGINYPF